MAERFPEITIYAQIDKDNVPNIVISPSDDVKRLKELINQKAGPDNYVEKIFFSGKLLEEGKSIGSYGLTKNGSTITCMMVKGDTQQVETQSSVNNIVVRFKDGSVNTIQFNPSDNVSELKKVIKNKKGGNYSVENLIYNGLKMQDNRSLESYGLKKSVATIFCVGNLIGG
jgi:hypothetical protein